jgi:predicted hotdog family 3-hydroxylacyl-ACP dehydratase
MKIDLTLPLPAEAFIPHRPPMRLVETLVSYGDAGGVVEANLDADCLLVDEEGALDEAAFVELLAQGYAVIKGYDDTLHGKAISEGYLVGVRKMRITGSARAGERLLVTIRTVGSFEGFAVAEGEVVRGTETIASGSIKLWIVGAGSAS